MIRFENTEYDENLYLLVNSGKWFTVYIFLSFVIDAA